MDAACFGHLEICKYLVSLGANDFIVQCMAGHCGHTEVQLYLQEQRENTN